MKGLHQLQTAQRGPWARRGLVGGRGGFTLIEALIATALLGFSLIVMFGFHSQAVRSNMHARKMTACTYLSQTQMERLLSLPWDSSSMHGDLDDDLSDSTSSASPWAFLEQPNGASQPTAVNAANQTSDTLGEPIYYITWDNSLMDTTETWSRLRVRCQYYDQTFNQWRGTTVSTYRFRDG